VLFIETDVFSELSKEIWDDDEFGRFQAFLRRNPEAGKTVAGTGGMRKVRWAGSGRGKRGGARVIYYFERKRDQIWLFLIYLKARKDELTAREKATLRAVLEGWSDG